MPVQRCCSKLLCLCESEGGLRQRVSLIKVDEGPAMCTYVYCLRKLNRGTATKKSLAQAMLVGVVLSVRAYSDWTRHSGPPQRALFQAINRDYNLRYKSLYASTRSSEWH